MQCGGQRSKKLLELALRDSEKTNNPTKVGFGADDQSYSDRDSIIDAETLIQNGEELFQFKENLRPRRSNFLPAYCESTSSREKEPFSPDVSEYVPSHDESKEIPAESVHDISQPSTSLNAMAFTNPQHDDTKKNTKRNMPKKSDPGRKRKRNPENWKNNIQKRKKNSGEEFRNKRGKLIKMRQIKQGCNEKCSKKCSENLSVAMRTKIFTDFWALGDHNKQVEFVSRNVERMSKKYVLLEKIETSRRHWTFKYSFCIGGEKIQMCKKMFFDTLDITDKWITTIYKKIDMQESSCAVLDDRRGHHTNRPFQISEDVKATVRAHIMQIPFVDSHYVRARTEKKYFEETLTFSKLYKLYKEWIQEKAYEPALIATERQYREIFYNEYNIGFFKPKKDQCPTCDIYARASTEEREGLQKEYTTHIASKFVVRELKSYDKSLAQGSSSVVLASYDLQKILSTPMSEVSLFYYKRKLAVYNFTIFDIGKNEGFCYVWDETIGKKGANEISSAVYWFIEMKVIEGFKDFIFYSDNCGGQNRNRIVFCMYAFAAKKFNINITHVFHEVGHTQNEGDSMHALIERRKKNQIVYVPEQWISIIRCAKSSGKPYNVTEMNQSKILDFKDLMNKQNNFDVGVDNNKIKWNKVRCLKIDKGTPNLIQVHYNFLSEISYHIDIDKKQGKKSSRNLAKTQNLPDATTIIPSAYRGPLPISKAKYKDLNSLCNSKAIPELYHNYYKNLKYIDGVAQDPSSDSE